jgi:hypothetical protein
LIPAVNHQQAKNQMDTYVKWTDEEWAALAKRAAALKAAKPDMSWTQIVPVCQDDIPPERRRFTINKLSGLKPMFDILGLDEQGNVKPPPPPPPEPKPEPQPAAVSTATPPFNPTGLANVPIEALVAEILSRGAALKENLDGLVNTKAAIMEVLEANKVKLDTFLKRVDEVEAYVLQCMEGMDAIKADNERTMAFDRRMEEAMRMAGMLPKSPAKLEDILPPVPPAPPENKRIAPVRILVVGLLEKELPRIKERLPRHLNVDLIHGENSDSINLPTNIHYAVVSGHNDCLRRWQTVLAHYGDKAHRMPNGAIGSFVHAIENLCVRRG